jgi:hypothetical protein
MNEQQILAARLLEIKKNLIKNKKDLYSKYRHKGPIDDNERNIMSDAFIEEHNKEYEKRKNSVMIDPVSLYTHFDPNENDFFPDKDHNRTDNDYYSGPIVSPEQKDIDTGTKTADLSGYPDLEEKRDLMIDKNSSWNQEQKRQVYIAELKKQREEIKNAILLKNINKQKQQL